MTVRLERTRLRATGKDATLFVFDCLVMYAHIGTERHTCARHHSSFARGGETLVCRARDHDFRVGIAEKLQPSSGLHGATWQAPSTTRAKLRHRGRAPIESSPGGRSGGGLRLEAAIDQARCRALPSRSSSGHRSTQPVWPHAGSGGTLGANPELGFKACSLATGRQANRHNSRGTCATDEIND